MWSHQIAAKREQKLVYGRGSPEMNFSSEVVNEKKIKEFEGALPTTIYQAGFSEVYGKKPDIDSTALMLSTTSWILTRLLPIENESTRHNDHRSSESVIAAENSSDYVSALLSKIGMTDPLKVTDFAIPKMLKAVDYLISCDKDGDGLLEQNHNEDWMDTILRSGKIVYSQACWLLALFDFAALLGKLGRQKEVKNLNKLARKTIQAVEQKLWSDEDGCYIDNLGRYHNGSPDRILTQDVSLYLVAVAQNKSGISTLSHRQNKEDKEKEKDNAILQIPRVIERHQIRAITSLNSMKERLWHKGWPLVTGGGLKASGPWILKPYQYHNQTFWPWVSGIEMLARSRFDQIKECKALLSKIDSGPNVPAPGLYEWMNPNTNQPSGAFPFRTGISSIRLALFDILCRRN
jgi:glycogen debranching enzyme